MKEINFKTATEEERTRYIDQLEKTDSRNYNIAGSQVKFKQTQVPLDILRFRVENGRWLLDLEEISRKENTDTESLVEKAEDKETQDILFEIALKYAKTKTGDKSIYQILKDSPGQTEELIIFPNGTVFNGNRRLAAMRQLEEEQNPSDFKYVQVNVHVLNANMPQKSLDIFQSNLQRKPQSPLEFHFMDTAFEAYTYKKNGKEDKEIRDLLNLKRNKESVNNEIKKYHTADEFLTWLSERREDINNDAWTWLKEQRFQQVFETACGDGGKEGYLIFEGPDHKMSKLILFNILENASLEKNNPNTIKDSAHDYMLLHKDMIESLKDQKIEVNTFDEYEKKDDAYDLINQTFTDVKNSKQKVNLNDLVLKNLQNSITRLNGVNLSEASPEDYKKIEQLLTRINSLSKDLMDDLKSF
tara:strand:- start:14 stop:1258 length:1245 start_codon:yes stop_codon:yes gene_type:complete